MKFLANENFPFPSINLLREKGLEIFSIAENTSAISDKEILEKASKESLVILTFDRDYGELIFKYMVNNPPSVVYFRFKGANPLSAGEVLIRLINEHRITLTGTLQLLKRKISGKENINKDINNGKIYRTYH